jgi:hypothetical protein
MANTNPPYDPLVLKMWQTKGTRFTAAERLRAKQRWSTMSLTMLSLYLIAVSIADLLELFSLQNSFKDYQLASILFLSIFILIINLIENSKTYLVEAEKMHHCALEIQSLHHTAQLLVNENKFTFEWKESLYEKYDTVLNKFPNHEERAYKIFKAINSQEPNYHFFGISNLLFKTLISKILLLWYWMQDFWMYILFIFLPPIMTLHLAHEGYF